MMIRPTDSKPVMEQPQEWRKAIPALGVALVACVIFLYGWLVAKPNVPARYRALCEVALNQVGLGSSDDLHIDESDEGVVARREKYNLINIYLKRLVEDPKQLRWARLQTARLSEAYSDLFSQLSTLAYRAGDPKKGERFQSQSTSERTKAKDLMEELAKDDAPESIEANAWLVSQALSAPSQEPDQLQSLADRLHRMVEQMPHDKGMRTRLGQVKVLQAFDYRAYEQATERNALLTAARKELEQANDTSVLNQAFLSEAYSLVDEQRSISAAMTASQTFWKLPTVSQRTPETLAAMAVCLMRLGSPEEAKGLLNSRLGSMPESTRKVTLKLTADGIWRLLETCSLSPSDATKQLVGPSIELLVVLDPLSERLKLLLRQLVIGDVQEPWVEGFQRLLESMPEIPYMQYVAGLQAAGKDDWIDSRVKLRTAASLQPGLTHYFATAISNFAEEDVRPVAFAMRFHEQLVREAPQNLFTWFERIRFSIAHEEFETARESLAVVEANAGQNLQVLAAIEAYYRELKLDDDAQRIRDRIQSLRPTKQ